jgi:hypothetical protein
MILEKEGAKKLWKDLTMIDAQRSRVVDDLTIKASSNTHEQSLR